MRTTNYSRSHGDISNARLSELVAEMDRMLQEKQGRLIRGIPASTTGRSPTELSSSAAAPSTKQAYL
jgi:hypothetical protein